MSSCQFRPWIREQRSQERRPFIKFILTSFSLQRENLELFLKGCETYGLRSQDLFQVNDLYEHKNLYMVVDCIFALGGMVIKTFKTERE